MSPINYRLCCSRTRSCTAFTLSEMMIASTIAVTVMGLAVASSIGLFKNFIAVENYRNIHDEARRSLALINRDIRASSNLTFTSSNNVTLGVMNSAGTIDTVQYRLQGLFLQRTITPAGGGAATTETLTTNITTVTFERWTNPGTLATTDANTYELRVSMMVSNTSAFKAVEVSDLLQTRVLMRNKP